MKASHEYGRAEQQVVGEEFICERSTVLTLRKNILDNLVFRERVTESNWNKAHAQKATLKLGKKG